MVVRTLGLSRAHIEERKRAKCQKMLVTLPWLLLRRVHTYIHTNAQTICQTGRSCQKICVTIDKKKNNTHTHMQTYTNKNAPHWQVFMQHYY